MRTIVRFITLAAMSVMGFTPNAVARSMGADSFAAAPTIMGIASIEQLTDTSQYTIENGEPLHKPIGLPGRSAWWKWTAPADGWCTVETLQTNEYVDTTIAVYTGTAINALTRVARGDDSIGYFTSRVTFYATTGSTYSIAVDSASITTPEVLLQLRFIPAIARRFVGNWKSPNQNLAPSLNGYLTLSITPSGAATGVITKGVSRFRFKTQARTDGIIAHTFPQALTPLNPSGAPLTVIVDPAYAGDEALNPAAIYVTDGVELHGTGRLLDVPNYSAANPCPDTGVFNLHLNMGPPAGTGFATVRISETGAVRVVGLFGDGQPMKFGSQMTADRDIPIHQGFAGGAGFLNGRLNADGKPSTLFTFDLTYRRPPATGLYYPSGIVAKVSGYAIRYAKPTPGKRALGFLDPTTGAGKLATIDAPGELGALTESLTYTTANKFLFTNTTRKPALKINTASGLVTGSITTAVGVKRSIRGILAKDEVGGLRVRGFVTGTTRTVAFVVSP